MILYLVRHGQSLYNLERRIQGQADVALSPLGLRQGAAVAAALAKLPIDAVYSSPLRRAMETAEPVAAEHGLTIHTDDRLKEINAGVFQGLIWNEIEAQYPEAGRHWREQTPDYVIPGGESRNALAERGQAALEAIRAAGHEQVVVVAHGGVLAGGLKRLLRIPPELSPFSFYNASISRLVWNGKLKLMTLNQTEHLQAAGLAVLDSTGDL